MRKVKYDAIDPRESCPFDGLCPPEAREMTFRIETRDGVRYDQAMLSTGLAGQIDWLWPGHIPFGRVTLIEGPAMVGKSLLVLDLAARLSEDRPWPDGTPQAKTGSKAVIICRQDDMADVVGARLEALGADPNRCIDFREFDTIDEEEHCEFRSFSLPFDLPSVERLLERDPAIRLLVVDSLSDVCPGRKQMAETIHRLNRLACDRKLAVVITLRAQARFDRQQQLVTKSRFETDAARCQWCCVSDPDDPQKSYFLPTLMNYSELPQGYVYRPRARSVDWLPKRVDPRDPRQNRKNCAVWLKGLLAEGDEQASVVRNLAKEYDFSADQLRRTFDAIGATKFRAGFGGKVYWSIGAGKKRGAEEQCGARNAECGAEMIYLPPRRAEPEVPVNPPAIVPSTPAATAPVPNNSALRTPHSELPPLRVPNSALPPIPWDDSPSSRLNPLHRILDLPQNPNQLLKNAKRMQSMVSMTNTGES